MDAPPLAWVLLPIRAPIQVAFAQNGHALLAALVPAVVVAAIHYLWVLSTQVSFEEASLEYAEQRARLVESRRSQGRAPRLRQAKTSICSLVRRTPGNGSSLEERDRVRPGRIAFNF